MKYDFDTHLQRRGTNCAKWDDSAADDILPLWVADMDFAVAPAIHEAIMKRAAHPVFGYTQIPQSYYDAIAEWFGGRHQWTIQPEWIIPTTGVIPAISSTIKAVCMAGEKVLVMTPVYNHFFSSIFNNGCQVEESPLVLHDDYYEVDWSDFEQRASDPKTTLFLLCNPHNPAGRVWRRDELIRMAEICRDHNVTICSDEIHCELTRPQLDYNPMWPIADKNGAQCVVLNSPSKAFNIAGLQIANVICSNAELRRRIDRAININEVCDVNPFGVVALEAAYRHGGDWLDELRAYLWDNYKALCQFFSRRFPQLTVIRLEGTYLAWIDVKALGMNSQNVEQMLIEKACVRIAAGNIYGQRDGEGFIRINMACPRDMLLEALNRIGNVFGPLLQTVNAQ